MLKRLFIRQKTLKRARHQQKVLSFVKLNNLPPIASQHQIRNLTFSNPLLLCIDRTAKHSEGTKSTHNQLL